MRLSIGTFLACLIALSSSPAISQASQSTSVPSPPLIVGKMAAPKLDGRVGAAEWKNAGEITSFADISNGNPAKTQSKAYVGYDDKTLYIAVVCDEPMMSKAAKKKFEGRDREVWTNECAEIYLNPSGDKISFFHFIADILGQKFDALGADPYGYNPDWKAAAYKGDKYWSVEVAVPFSAINTKTPEAGDSWYALIGRERQAQSELSASTPTFGAFDAVGRYGSWVFSSLKTNLQRQASKLQDNAKTWPSEMSADSATWRQHLQEFDTQLSGMDEQAVLAAYPKIAADLDSLQKEANPLKLRAIHITAGGKSVLVTKAYPYQPFVGGQLVAGEQAGPVNLTMLQDEYVDLAFNLTNLSDAPITLRCTTRQGDANGDYNTLSLRGIDTQWQQAYAVAAGDGEKVWDAVVPTPAGTIELLPGITSQVWLSVHTPKDAAGDISGQIVIECTDGAPVDTIRLPIKITTLPIQLTANNPLNAFTWDAFKFPLDKYVDQAQAHYRDWKAHGITMIMLSSFRVLPRVKANADGSITEPMDFTKADAVIDASHGIIDKYYITMDIWETDWLRKDLIGLEWKDPAYAKAFKNWWRIVLNHLKSKGLSYDNFIVNPADECSDQRFVDLNHWIKEVDPKVQTVIDSHGGDILKKTHNPSDMADIWMPHYTQYFDEVYKKNIEIVKESKMPLWVYYYSESGNEKRMDPNSRYLSKFWWAFSNNITGMGYWAEQLYGDPWYRKGSPNSYDTSLTYPTETGVVPSRRWQAWRQGWQDYCLLNLVKQKLTKDDDKAGLTEFNSDVQDTLANGIDPAKTDAVRTWLKTKLTKSP